MEDLPEEEKNMDVVDELELQYYEVQLELYEVKFEILKNEEILIITQLDSIRRYIKGKIYIKYTIRCLREIQYFSLHVN